jgi:hypothetical protein
MVVIQKVVGKEGMNWQDVSLLWGFAWILFGRVVAEVLSILGLLLWTLLWQRFLEPSQVSDSVIEHPLRRGRDHCHPWW